VVVARERRLGDLNVRLLLRVGLPRCLVGLALEAGVFRFLTVLFALAIRQFAADVRAESFDTVAAISGACGPRPGLSDSAVPSSARSILARISNAARSSVVSPVSTS
jgi:hypothetical protein